VLNEKNLDFLMKVKKESLKKFLVLRKEQFFSPVKN
jgi:hypothetical protein